MAGGSQQRPSQESAIRDQLHKELEKFASKILRPEIEKLRQKIDELQGQLALRPQLSEADAGGAVLDVDAQTGMQRSTSPGMTRSTSPGMTRSTSPGQSHPKSWLTRVRSTMQKGSDDAPQATTPSSTVTVPKSNFRAARAGYAKVEVQDVKPSEANALPDSAASEEVWGTSDTDETEPQSARRLLKVHAEGDVDPFMDMEKFDSKSTIVHGGIIDRVNRAQMLLQQHAAENEDEESVLLTDTNKPQLFTNHPAFEYTGACIIFANLLFMGMQADFTLKHVGEEEPVMYKHVSLVFCVVFSIEIAIRIAAEGLPSFFYYSRDVAWNFFDTLIVAFQIMDDVLPMMISSAESSFNFSFLRILRVLRTLRILRLAKMCKFVSELRILLVTLGGSLKSLFWTCVLLLALTYSFGLLVAQIIADRAEQNHFDALQSEELHGMFGSIFGTMWTLYLSVSNGLEWSHPASILSEDVTIWALPAFGLYIAFTVFALLNIITGIFLNTAMATAEADRYTNVVEQIERVFKAADKDNSGEVSLSEFTAQLDEPEMQIYIQGLGWRRDQAMELFNILDIDGSGEVNLSEFIAGCTRLQGGTKAVDFAAFMCEYEKLSSRMFEHMDIVERVLHYCEHQFRMSERINATKA